MEDGAKGGQGAELRGQTQPLVNPEAGTRDKVAQKDILIVICMYIVRSDSLLKCSNICL